MRVHEQLFLLRCGLFDDKTDVLDIISLYIGKILQKQIFLNVSVQYFIGFDVKYITFREPVLGICHRISFTLI